MLVVRNASLYFALVFAAGFVLGTIRVPLLVRRFGERAAELIEAPIMLAVLLFAARWLVRRAPASRSELLLSGLLAAAFVLLADLLVGVVLRGMSPIEVVIERDPVSGGVYYGLLALFAIMPWRIGGRAGPSGDSFDPPDSPRRLR